LSKTSIIIGIHSLSTAIGLGAESSLQQLEANGCLGAKPPATREAKGSKQFFNKQYLSYYKL